MKAYLPTGDLHRMVRLDDVTEPKTAQDEAVVGVEAYSVNRGETFQLASPKLHWRPGKDVAGRVLRAAADGSGPPEGTRVVGHPASQGWAERVAVPTRQLAPLPDSVSIAQAAALPLAGLTALRLLRIAGPLASRRVLMTGASGGVGHYLAELLAPTGADLTVVTATPERAQRLLELGASCAVHDVAAAQGPYDVVLESVGGASFTTALSKRKPHGSTIWFGQAGGVAPTVDFFAFFNGPSSGTIHHFDYTDSDVPDGIDLATLVRLVADGRLHPEIGLLTDWAQTAETLDTLRERGLRGNAVLTVGRSHAALPQSHPA